MVVLKSKLIPESCLDEGGSFSQNSLPLVIDESKLSIVRSWTRQPANIPCNPGQSGPAPQATGLRCSDAPVQPPGERHKPPQSAFLLSQPGFRPG